MSDSITLTGLVATEPRHLQTSEGLAITSFRLASTQRRYDRVSGRWVDGETNWYTVSAFRQLALNAAASLRKGERVVVAGRLKLREWNTGEKAGINVEVEAESLGHDLMWGTARYARTVGGAGATSEHDAAAESDSASESGSGSGEFTPASERELASTPF